MSAYKFAMLRPVALTESGAFIRPSIGTYVDSDGLVKIAAEDVPRFYWRDGVPRGLLLESAATNKFTRSQEFDAGWTAAGSTVGINAETAPDGTLTADRMVVDTTTNSHSFLRSIGAVAAGESYALSVFAKRDTGARYLRLRIGSSGFTANSVLFDLDTGEAVYVDPAYTPYTESLANGWWRLGVVAMLPLTGGAAPGFESFQSMDMSAWAGDGVSGILLWGAQIELGDKVTSYIPTDASTATRFADVNTLKLVSNVDEPATGADPDPAEWNAATSYTVGQQATRLSRHEIYQRLIAGTTATAPELDTANWVLVGKTNRWRMFDGAFESQTSQAEAIQVTLQPGKLADAIALDNLEGSSVNVRVEGTSYDQTVKLKTRACSNWFQYYFEPFTFKKSAVFTGLPALTSNSVHISIHNPGGTAKCGYCIPGHMRSLGYAEPGANVGIIDFSTKSVDQFGQTSVVQRAYSKRMNISVVIQNTDLDSVLDLLAKYRATPVVWIGAGDQYSALVIYGYYRSFDIVIPYPTQSRCDLEIEGLT